mgnify:CR=1 FL=1
MIRILIVNLLLINCLGCQTKVIAKENPISDEKTYFQNQIDKIINTKVPEVVNLSFEVNKSISKTLPFNVTKDDLNKKKIFILTIINGINESKFNKIDIKVNNLLITDNNNFIDNNTSDISLEIKNLKEGKNLIEFEVNGSINGKVNINIKEFINPINILGAMNFSVPEPQPFKKYNKGKLTLKFMPGIKVKFDLDNKGNILRNREGIEVLKELNGISLTTFYREVKKLGIKSITYYPVSFVEFYDLKIDENKDIIEVRNELIKLPYIEEAAPDPVLYSADFDIPDEQPSSEIKLLPKKNK